MGIFTKSTVVTLWNTSGKIVLQRTVSSMNLCM